MSSPCKALQDVPETALLQDTGLVHARETLRMDFDRVFQHRTAQAALPLVLIRPNLQNSPSVWRDCGVAEQFAIAHLQHCHCWYPEHLQWGPGPLQAPTPSTFALQNFVPWLSSSFKYIKYIFIDIKFACCKMLVHSTVSHFSDNQRSPVIIK